MYGDPFNRGRRDRRRAIEEQRRAEEARRRQGERAGREIPPQLLARFEAELVAARRERDEWADRYEALRLAVAEERERLSQERAALEAAQAEQQAALQADAEQMRLRLQRNAELRLAQESRRTFERLLEVADNLERALVGSPAESALADGVRLTLRDFLRALESAGVSRLESLGQPFDPAHHEAVATRASDAPAGQVVEVVAPGYLYRDLLLRPARVVVAE